MRPKKENSVPAAATTLQPHLFMSLAAIIPVIHIGTDIMEHFLAVKFCICIRISSAWWTLCGFSSIYLVQCSWYKTTFFHIFYSQETFFYESHRNDILPFCRYGFYREAQSLVFVYIMGRILNHNTIEMLLVCHIPFPASHTVRLVN